MNTSKVTRFEVIDHRSDIPKELYGRVMALRNVHIDLSLQDDERTLKVFISDV